MPTTAYSPDEQSLDALFAAHEHLAADLATPDRALQRAEALTQSTGSRRPTRRRALTAAVVAGATLASGAAIQLSRSPGDPSVAAPVTADATDIAAARAAGR